MVFRSGVYLRVAKSSRCHNLSVCADSCGVPATLISARGHMAASRNSVKDDFMKPACWGLAEARAQAQRCLAHPDRRRTARQLVAAIITSNPEQRVPRLRCSSPHHREVARLLCCSRRRTRRHSGRNTDFRIANPLASRSRRRAFSPHAPAHPPRRRNPLAARGGQEQCRPQFRRRRSRHTRET